MAKSKLHLKRVSKVISVKGKLTKRSFWVKDGQEPKAPEFPQGRQVSGLSLKVANWALSDGTHPIRKTVAALYRWLSGTEPNHPKSTVGLHTGAWMDQTHVSSYRNKVPRLPGVNYGTITPFSRHNYYTRIRTAEQARIADMYRQ